MMQFVRHTECLRPRSKSHHGGILWRAPQDRLHDTEFARRRNAGQGKGDSISHTSLLRRAANCLLMNRVPDDNARSLRLSASQTALGMTTLPGCSLLFLTRQTGVAQDDSGWRFFKT